MVRIIIVMLMTLFYLSVVPDNPDALNPIINCLYSVEQLTSNSFLKWNEDNNHNWYEWMETKEVTVGSNKTWVLYLIKS